MTLAPSWKKVLIFSLFSAIFLPFLPPNFEKSLVVLLITLPLVTLKSLDFHYGVVDERLFVISLTGYSQFELEF